MHEDGPEFLAVKDVREQRVAMTRFARPGPSHLWIWKNTLRTSPPRASGRYSGMQGCAQEMRSFLSSQKVGR